MFTGFESPNFTQTPNQFFDQLLAQIDDLCELKVTLAVIRYTFGFHRTQAELSQSFLIQATGLTEKSVKKGIQLALRRGTIRIAQKATNRAGTVYEIVFQGDTESTPQRGMVDTPQRAPSVPPRNKENKINNSTDFAETAKSVPGPSAEGAPNLHNLRPVSGGSGMRYVPYDKMFDEDKPKKKVFAPRTPLAKYLSENARYGRDRHWEGFSSAKQRDEWERMEKDYDAEVVTQKIKWALGARLPRRVLAERIMAAVINYGKPKSKNDGVKLEKVVRDQDGGIYI